ncbi:MAG: RNase III inhibitor [Chloroflexi bacterium]|nr:MAG: RNase III inhibitor [Chloroflexota bacterium]
MEILEVNDSAITLYQGDITTFSGDAIVNASNQHLAGGGGVDGAIHRAGGSQIGEACRAIGSCPTGSAVATVAGRLAARHVIHAVAPRWHGGARGEADLLRSAYQRSLEVADEEGDRTVAFPSLGTGIYSYPTREAAEIALDTIVAYLQGATAIERVTFYLFSPADLRVYADVLEQVASLMQGRLSG